jgi:ribulose-phosphate 3-epimerase
MVSEPEKWVNDFAAAGASCFTFHWEATTDANALVDTIRQTTSMDVGIAIKPGTDVNEIMDIAAKVDMILVMTVEPGFGGQSFMSDMMPKVSALRTKYPTLAIQVDGGLSPKTIDIAAKAGANVIVSGSGVFKAEKPQDAISVMRKSVNAVCQV